MSFNVKLTPKEDSKEKRTIAHSTIKADGNHYFKDSLSPQRESMFDR